MGLNPGCLLKSFLLYSGFLPSNTANQAKLGIISTDAASYQEMGNGTAAWA